MSINTCNVSFKSNSTSKVYKSKFYLFISKCFTFFQGYAQTDRVEKKVYPEELIRATKPITTATGKAVAAGNSGKQEDVIVAANMGRKAIADLLTACKVGAYKPTSGILWNW